MLILNDRVVIVMIVSFGAMRTKAKLTLGASQAATAAILCKV